MIPFVALHVAGTLITAVVAFKGELSWAAPVALLIGAGMAVLHMMSSRILDMRCERREKRQQRSPPAPPSASGDPVWNAEESSSSMRQLYHVVKNVLVGVAGVLETPDELSADDREVCARSLRQGIDFIQHRTAFSALAAGLYTPQHQHLVFHHFFAGLAMPLSVKRGPRPGCRSLAGSFETLLLRCALVDSIANALSHGTGDVRLEYWVSSRPGQASTIRSGERHFGRDDDGDEAEPPPLMLHTAIYNELKPDTPPLTRARVAALLKDGATHGGGTDHSGMGLASVRFMLRSLGGGLELTQREPGGEVEALLSLPVADVAVKTTVHSPTTATWQKLSDVAAAPALTRVSPLALPHQLPSLTTPAVAASLAPATVPPAPAAAPPAPAAARCKSDDGGVGSPKPEQEKLRIVTVEDSPLLNKLYARQLPRLLGVPKESVRVLATEADARDALALALAFFDGAAPSCARVVVLDQNIDFVAKHGVCYFGTDIARALRARDFDGLIVLCSADPRDEIAARLSESETLDGAVGVGCGIDVVLEKSDVVTLADSVLSELRRTRRDARRRARAKSSPSDRVAKAPSSSSGVGSKSPPPPAG